MSSGIVISVIGGGSTYSPELIEGFIAHSLSGTLNIAEIRLMDIDESKLKIIGDFSQRMIKKAGANIGLRTFSDVRECLPGADFVLTQLRVGGNEARHQDILLGHRYGIIGQETVGVGGFAKALRTIPVIQEIVSSMKELCPNAWLINFTNPVSIVTEYLSRYTEGVKWMGLCNYPINAQKNIAALLSVKESEIDFDYYGLNHLSWINHIRLRGEDVTAKVMKSATEMERMKNIPAEQFNPELLRDLQMIPNFYLLYYYNTKAVLKKKMAASKTRAQEVMEVEEGLLKEYSNPELKEKPASLEKRGGAYYSTAAVDLINSIVNDTGKIHVINVRNQGTLDNIPDESSVEVKCKVFSDRIEPIPLPKTPEKIRELMNAVKEYEIHTAEAVFSGSQESALKALEANPLTNSCDGEALLAELNYFT